MAKKPVAKAAKPAPKAAPKAAKPAPKAAKPAKPAPAKVDLKTKAGLIAAMADAAKITKVQAAAAYDAFLGVAYKCAKAKEGYTVPGLCKLVVGERKARTGVVPGDPTKKIKIPKAKILKVKALKAAKDAVLKK